MKKLTEYILENKREYKFRLKFATPLTDELLDKIELALSKYNLLSVGKTTKTILQNNPLDFQHLPPCEIYIIDVVVEYPTTPDTLRNYLCNVTGINESHIVVRRTDHPEETETEEESMEDKEVAKEPLLGSDYDEEEQELVYGDKYNEKLINDFKEKRKNRMFSMVDFTNTGEGN